MNPIFGTYRIIAIISLVVFILTFFIFFRETHEIFSSLTAAILGALILAGAMIVVGWLIRVCSK